MLKRIWVSFLVWLLLPRYGGRPMTVNQWYRSRLASHAICMAIITLIAHVLGGNHSAFSEYGLLPSLVFNVIVGTGILHFIDRSKIRVV